MSLHTHKCSGGNCRICRITTDDVYYSGEFLYPLIVNTGDTVTSILQKINQKIDSGISITTGNLVEGTGISFLGNPRNRLVGSGNLTVNIDLESGPGIDITDNVITNTGVLTETDPTVPNWVKNITQTDINNWDSSFNSSITGISFDISDGDLTLTKQDSTTLFTNLDGRYLQSSDLPPFQTLSWSGSTNELTISNGNTVTITGFQEDLGYTPENVANKVTDFTTINNTNYPTTQAVVDYISDIAPGTVTSVGMTVPNGFTITGSPITSAGVLGVNFASGYSLPTVVKQLEWDDSYDSTITGVNFNPLTGNLTLTKRDSSTFITSLDGRYVETIVLDDYYTKTELQTSGQSQVHWDNITNTPDFIELTSLSAVSPINYNNTTGVFTIDQSGSTTDGYLSSTDWNTFNNKADSFSTGDIVAGTGVTFTGSGTNRLFGAGTLTIDVDPVDLSGYVPTTRIITIQGQARDLSQDRSWSFTTTDIPEGTNLYFTTTRARNSVSAGSGLDYDSVTGVFTNTAQDQVVTLTEGSNIVITGTYPNFTIAADLSDYYTIAELQTSGSSSVHWDNITNVPSFIELSDLSGTAPIVYNSTTGDISITQSGASSDGYLSSTDWNTFNDKADAFSTADIVAGTGITLSGSGVDRIIGSTDLTINAVPVDLSGYVPTSRTLTINGTTYDLTQNRSWTIPVADGSETVINAGTGITVSGNGTSATPYIISSPYQTLSWNNTTKTISISNGNSQVLTGIVSSDVSITNSYGINIGGDLSTGLSIGLDTTVVDLRYLRKDVDDDNGSNKLTLGSLEAGPTEITGTLTLGSVASGPMTNNFLTIDPSTGAVEQTILDVDLPELSIADGTGTEQFSVDLSTEDLRFVGTGDTVVSFNASTNTVTINSVPGQGGGGVITSVFGRTGPAILAEAGDYNTSLVTETTNLYFTEPRVLNTALTGFTTLAGTITATDTVLEALGKAQAQISARVPTSRTITINGTAGRVVVGGATQNLTANRTWSVDLAEAGTAGTYTKVTTDAYGRVTSGTTLQTSDLPISAGSGIAISPTGVISNTAQDETVSITGSGLTYVTGTYPNFNVDTTLVAGSGINITGNTISATATTPNLQQVTDVGNTTNNVMVVTGGSDRTRYSSAGADIRVISPTGGWSRTHSVGINDGVDDIGVASFGGFGGASTMTYGYLSSKLTSAHSGADLKFIDGRVGINLPTTTIPNHNLSVNGTVAISSLSGAGTRMVVAGSAGVLSTQAIPDLSGYTPTSRQILSGNGLTGGGDLTADRTITMGTPSSITATSINEVTSTSHTHELAANSVVTAKIANSNVTFAKLQNIPTQTLIGRYSTGTGSAQSITLGTGLSLNGTGVLSATNTTTGTVTSVSSTVGGTALSVDVTNPTTTPNLAFDWEGTTSQYVTGAGTLVNFPNIPQGTVTSVTIGNGLTGASPITSTGTITLGTPSSITLSSTNSVTAGSHTHLFAPGGTISQYIDGTGALRTFPTIPTVNDGDLTLSTSGIASGSATFSANQSTNSTFTVNVPGTDLGSFLTGNDLTITSSTGLETSIDLSSITIDGRYAVIKTGVTAVSEDLTTGDDLDTTYVSGILGYDNSVTNNPTPAGGVLFSGTRSGTHGFQMAGGVTAEDEFYYRKYLSGTKGSWYQVASREWVTSQMPAAQTLSLGTQSGEFSISGGNSVRLTSLNNENRPDADVTNYGNGVQVYTNTTGSTNYPTAAGGGYVFRRTISANNGSLDIHQTTSASPPLFRYGTGVSTWSDWQTFASQEWVTSQNYGTVSSVGGGFLNGNSITSNVTNPTTTPNLLFTWAGSSSQYVRGDGTLATFPTIPTVNDYVSTDPNSNNPSLANFGGDLNAPIGMNAFWFNTNVTNKPSFVSAGGVILNLRGISSSTGGGFQLASGWDDEAIGYRSFSSSGNPNAWHQIASREWVNTQVSGFVPNTRTITAGNGLTGGGNLTANRTITLGTPSSITLSSTNSVTSTSHTHAFTPGGTTAQYIRGDGSLATFPNIPAGTVTSVGASFTGNAINIGGSPITSSGTLAFSFTGNSLQYVNGAGNLTTFPTIPTYTGSTSITLSGSSFQRAALTGDVTAPANSNVTTIANNAVTTAKIANNAVTLPKLEEIDQYEILGRYSPGSGSVQKLKLGSGFDINTTTGEVSASGGWIDEMGYDYEGNADNTSKGLDTRGGYATRSHVFITNSSVPDDVENCIFIGGADANLSLPDPALFEHRVITITNSGSATTAPALTLIGHIPYINVSSGGTINKLYYMYFNGGPTERLEAWITIQSIYDPIASNYKWAVIKKGN